MFRERDNCKAAGRGIRGEREMKKFRYTMTVNNWMVG